MITLGAFVGLSKPDHELVCLPTLSFMWMWPLQEAERLPPLIVTSVPNTNKGVFCWNCIIRSWKGIPRNLNMFVQKHSDGSTFPRSPALSFKLAGRPSWKISFPPQSNPNLRFWRLCRGPQSCSRHSQQEVHIYHPQFQKRFGLLFTRLSSMNLHFHLHRVSLQVAAWSHPRLGLPDYPAIFQSARAAWPVRPEQVTSSSLM